MRNSAFNIMAEEKMNFDLLQISSMGIMFQSSQNRVFEFQRKLRRLMAVIPLSKRPIDIAIVLFFVINGCFISILIDMEPVFIPDLKACVFLPESLLCFAPSCSLPLSISRQRDNIRFGHPLLSSMRCSLMATNLVTR